MGKNHKIKAVEPGSIAQELSIEPGDSLKAINGRRIEDIFDYHYLTDESRLTVTIGKKNGEEWEYTIEKGEEEDLGLVFEAGLMDEYRSCRNNCIFCFIDQMPPGMRDTLYFKDDDSRLSFLQGNYVTLTNLQDSDVERMIHYHLSPINISVHTTNPELRCRMLHNRFAGDALSKMRRLYEGGIRMNSQIVLCKGYNDGKELDRTISDLSGLIPGMESLSVVPVGLTRYRNGLAPLEKFTGPEAKTVLSQLNGWQDRLLARFGTRFVFPSDEWYLLAGEPLPPSQAYEGYGQIENGVGMVRSFTDEFSEYLRELPGDLKERKFSMATGELFAPVLQTLLEQLRETFPNTAGRIYPIKNYFFGEDITVAGLLTGKDIKEQLSGQELGDYLLLPQTLLRNGEKVLLDDVTVEELEGALQIKIRIVPSDGASLAEQMLKETGRLRAAE